MRQGRYIDRTLEVVTIKCEVITGCLSGTCGPVFCPRAGVRINKLVVVVGQGPESISIYYLPCPRESLPITGGTLIIKSVWALLDSAHVLAVSLSFHFHIQSDLGSLPPRSLGHRSCRRTITIGLSIFGGPAFFVAPARATAVWYVSTRETPLLHEGILPRLTSGRSCVCYWE